MSKTGLMKFYKSQGAAQFKVLPPVWKQVQSKYSDQPREMLDKEGAILLEIAPGNGDRKNPSWDWSKKISFAISFTDISQLIETTEQQPNGYKRNRLRGPSEPSAVVFHQHNNSTKMLRLEPGIGQYQNTWKLLVSENNKSTGLKNSVMVPLSDGEHSLLMRVLTSMAPALVGFE